MKLVLKNEVKAIICDGNRDNQAFFKMHDIVPGKPWLTVDERYLLFDFVHLLKNIRNLWLTETTRALIFYDKRVSKIAKWAHLKKLFDLEQGSILKLSDLNKVSVAPKPFEQQRVSIGVTRGGPRGPGPPPIKIPLTTKSYDNIAWRCLVAVFFQ